MFIHLSSTIYKNKNTVYKAGLQLIGRFFNKANNVW